MGYKNPLDSRNSFFRPVRVPKIRKIIVLTSFCGFFTIFGLMKWSAPQGEISISLLSPQISENSTDPIDTWRYIGDKKNRHQIFSAYFDSRLGILDYYSPDYDGYQPYGSVRIFGVLTTHWRLRVYCFFMYEDGKIRQVPALEYRPITDHRDLEFSAYTIMCPLTYHNSLNPIILPKYVAICYEDDPLTLSQPTYVPIRYHKESAVREPDRTLAVCVGPIHDHYSQARRLVEFVHIYQLMGAEKFYFYNLSATAAVNRVLKHFEQQGFVQNLEWNLYNYKFEVELRYAGIFVALNECVYRATFVDGFKFVAVVDLDEILMSYRYENLVEYIKKIDTENTGSYVFRGVFLHKSDGRDLSNIPQGIKNNFLYTQSRIRRTSEPFPGGDRSKYIVKARAAIEMGNHFVPRPLGTYKAITFLPDKALLFHYRDDCVFTSCTSKRTTDLTMRRFGSLLWNMVEKTCDEIFLDGICPIYSSTQIMETGIVFV